MSNVPFSEVQIDPLSPIRDGGFPTVKSQTVPVMQTGHYSYSDLSGRTGSLSQIPGTILET